MQLSQAQTSTLLRSHSYQMLRNMLVKVFSKGPLERTHVEMRELEAWACVALPEGDNAYSEYVAKLASLEGFKVSSAHTPILELENGRWYCGTIDLGYGHLIHWAPLIVPFQASHQTVAEFYEVK